MPRVPDTVRFAVVFTALTLVLGWVFWMLTPTGGALRNTMMVVPAVSAMIAARGYGTARKLAYAAATVAGYTAVAAIASATGLHARVGVEISSGVPSVWAALYIGFLTAYPFMLLVLFVGRQPSRLWSARG